MGGEDAMNPLTFSSQDQTEAWARTLAVCLQAGDVILLSGELGTGKSTFARALIRTLTHGEQDVPSPTFTLVQLYKTSTFPLWHFDLYRLTSPEEIFELGIEETQEGVVLIEWPEKMGPFLPKEGLHLTFEYGEKEDTRRLTLEAPPSWRNRIQSLFFPKAFKTS